MPLGHASATRTAGSPPPCGEGLGVGVLLKRELSAARPPSPALPHKGGGSPQRIWRRVRSASSSRHRRQFQRRVDQGGRPLVIVQAVDVLLHGKRAAAVELLVLLVAA